MKTVVSVNKKGSELTQNSESFKCSSIVSRSLPNIKKITITNNPIRPFQIFGNLKGLGEDNQHSASLNRSKIRILLMLNCDNYTAANIILS